MKGGEMSQRKNKKFRKEARRVAWDEFISSMYWIKRMPLRLRVGYAWRILKGVKRNG